MNIKEIQEYVTTNQHETHFKLNNLMKEKRFEVVFSTLSQGKNELHTLWRHKDSGECVLTCVSELGGLLTFKMVRTEVDKI